MKSWKKYLSIAGGLFVLALAAIVTVPVKAETDETSTIPQRVYFGEVPVGGMTQEEAKAAVEEYINGKLTQNNESDRERILHGDRHTKTL